MNLGWLLREDGPKRPNQLAEPGGRGYKVLETTTEVDGVELTKQAIQVAKAFMDLPRNRRDDYQQQIETEALKSSSRTPDEKLRHLAAPTAQKKLRSATAAVPYLSAHRPGSSLAIAACPWAVRASMVFVITLYQDREIAVTARIAPDSTPPAAGIFLP